MYECKGICASGLKCTRNCFLNRHGYCRDHKNQYELELRYELRYQLRMACQREKYKLAFKFYREHARNINKQRSIDRLNARLNSDKDTLGKWKSYTATPEVSYIETFRKWLPKENPKEQKSYIESIQRLENRIDSMSEILKSMKEDLKIFQQE